MQSETKESRDIMAVTQQMMTRVFAPGTARLEANDFEGAAAEFKKVADEFPGLAAGYTAYGGTLLALGRAQEALDPLLRAIELVPGASSLHNQLGVAQFMTGAVAEAEATFLKSATLDPQYVQPLLNLVDLYRWQGRYVEATSALDAAVSAEPEGEDVLVSLATVSLEVGNIDGAQSALAQLQQIVRPIRARK
jgi:Flp pilus assembly protein TadD